MNKIKQKISIVIPCFNEAHGLKQLFSKLDSVAKKLKSDFEIEIVFVDDGSTDSTYKMLAEKYGQKATVQIIRHTENRGLGKALRTAFSKVSGDIIVTIDSDCTYDPEEIPDLIFMLQNNASIVVGSPYHPDGKTVDTSFLRLLLSKSLSKIYQIFLSRDIHTYTGIFRAYRKNVITGIDFNSSDFLALSEILAKAILKGYEIVEYPTTLCCRKYDQSKMRIFSMIFKHLKFIFSLAFKKRQFLKGAV